MNFLIQGNNISPARGSIYMGRQALTTEEGVIDTGLYFTANGPCINVSV